MNLDFEHTLLYEKLISIRIRIKLPRLEMAQLKKYSNVVELTLLTIMFAMAVLLLVFEMLNVRSRVDIHILLFII